MRAPPRNVTLVLLALALVMAAVATVAPRGGGRRLIVVITPSLDNPFFGQEASAAVRRAHELGYKTLKFSHGDDAFRQSQLIDVAIAREAAAVILDNAGAEASVAAVARAEAAHIPVFLIDREISARGVATAQIVSNNFQGAELSAGAFVAAVHGRGAYAELTGRESDSNAVIRSRGFHAVLDQYRGLRMVSRQSANWDEARGYSVTQSILQAHPEIRGVVAGNDTMAMGAIAAVRSAGRGDIAIVGFDGSNDARDAILTGRMVATALQPATRQARYAVDLADRYLRTGSTGQREKLLMDCILIDRANAARLHDFTLTGG